MSDWSEYSRISTSIVGPIVVFGALANSLSLLHFYRKSGEGLGNVFLFYLNSADFFVSIVGILVNMIPLLATLSKTIFLLGVISTLGVFSFGADITRLITTFLCVIRTILVVKPLFRLRKRVIKISFLFLALVTLGYRLFILAEICPPIGEIVYKCFNADKLEECDEEDSSTLFTEVSIEEYINITVTSTHTLIVVTCCILTTVQLLKPNEELGASRTSDTNRKAAYTALLLSLICVIFNMASVGCSAYIAAGKHKAQASFVKTAVLGSFLNMQFVPLNSALNPIVYIMRTSALRERVRDMWRRIGHCFRRVFVSRIHPPTNTQ